jgi:hypothetical protein
VRFIARIGDKYAAITRDRDIIEQTSNSSLRNLLTAVSLKPKPEITYRIHGEGYLERLELIYRTMKRNAITLASDENRRHNAFYLITRRETFLSRSNPYSERFTSFRTSIISQEKSQAGSTPLRDVNWSTQTIQAA